MCTWQYSVFIVAMATISGITSSLDQQHGSSVRPISRRFLFSTQNNINMCNMFCPLVCPQGFVMSSSGCLLCQCASISNRFTTFSPQSSTVKNILHPYTSVNGGIFFDKPCNPAVRHCRLQCTLGYLKGGNGCQYCICQSTSASYVTTPVSRIPSTAGNQVSTSANLTLPPSTRPSVTLSPIIQPNVTLSQLTRPRTTSTTMIPSLKPTSVRLTTPISTLPDASYSDPCISSQKTCDKPCGGNYVKGPGWCQYCLCAQQSVKDLQTTTLAPGTLSGKLATIPHYLDMSPTSEACIMAKVICNQKCEHGFVSHPGDCLYCSCRKQADVPVNDDPDSFYVTLPNPCVKHTETCGIMCLNGYILGPRDCEFCSCRN